MAEDFELPDAVEDDFANEDYNFQNEATSGGPIKVGEDKEIVKGGIKKLLLKEGTGWETPEAGDEVKVHYTGTLLDGTKFDSSRDRGDPFTFKLGQGQVIKGWDQGVGTMKKGEVAVFTIEPLYAYGESGSPPTIPPNATLKFEIELLSWASVKDICKDGGVFKKIIVEGEKWESPKDADEVTIRYEAKLEDGTVIEKTPEEGVEFYLGDGCFVPAIAKAVKTMKRAEKVQLTVKPSYGFGAAGRSPSAGVVAVPPNATLLIDLDLVSWKSVEEVTDDKRVMKKVLKSGEGYDKPNDGATVQVKYIAKLADGTIFEKEGHDGDLFEFVSDEEQVIAGLDRAIGTMKKGEISLVTIAPDYGYGDVETKRALATVPPKATLTFEVELVSFVKEKENWDVDNAEKTVFAAKKKEEGNVLFKAGKFWRASKKYEKAVKFVEVDSAFDDEQKKQSKVLKVSCYTNNAACKLKLKSYHDAVKLATKALEVDSSNVKALFRRAQGYIEIADYDLAEWDIKKALELEPKNTEVKVLAKSLKQKQIEQNKKEAKLYGNMFARLSKLEAKEAKTTEPMEEDKANDGSANGIAKIEEVEEMAVDKE
eukprot:TRINITY_DN1451_c0_g1_i1.p1 TRINITY_DN1451_c0_g1~~TRINITY_DN1451_c0_g1_i1.p1  ORF type:complete len:595 (+),score=183.93 TRINITY_DN1451_c0_g1_i1:170-1954(+)